MDRERIGKYRILGEVGRGTMGVVYRALDLNPVLNRPVALKTISVQMGLDDETLQRFRREARAAALLNHPNIVTIYDYGEEKGVLYMAMELLEGPDLRDAIDGDLLGSLEDKLDVLDAVLRGLEYAHGQDVVHRDIKPANIHLGSGRQVKIMDFGLARLDTSEMTQEGIVLGTPNYMSPEQALGDKVDGRSDVFSTGAVLYELLTGHKPFEADSTPSVLFQVVHRQPPPVRRWAADVPEPLIDVVDRSLVKDKRKRFAGASEMRAALAAARQGSSPPGVLADSPSGSGRAIATAGAPGQRPRSSPTASGRRARRRRSNLPLIAAGAALALIVIAALAAPWIRGRLAPAAPVEGDSQVGELTRALVATQVQLAQRELEDKNWQAAETQALSALRLSPGHPGATRTLEAARTRLTELETAIASARQKLEAGDTDAASVQLFRVLEIDPRHPAATELSARLNTVFRTQADEANASMQAARDQAVAEKATDSREFAAANASAAEGEALAASEEYADATRTFLEARDTFDRARRAALARRQAAAAAPPAPALPEPTATPEVEIAGAESPSTAPQRPRDPVASPDRASSTPVRPAAAAAPVVPPRAFQAGRTTVTTPSAGELAGFESTDVTTQRPPRFEGRMEFEVLPSEVRPGQPFVVRLHLVNEGRRAVRIEGIEIATVEDGQRTAAPAQVLQGEVAPRDRALVAEYSGVWSPVDSWSLEAVAAVEGDERVRSRLRSE